MRELNVNEIKEVNGGIVSIYWLVVGGMWAYRSYRSVQFVTHALAGGAIYDGVKAMLD